MLHASANRQLIDVLPKQEFDLPVLGPIVEDSEVPVSLYYDSHLLNFVLMFVFIPIANPQLTSLGLGGCCFCTKLVLRGPTSPRLRMRRVQALQDPQRACGPARAMQPIATGAQPPASQASGARSLKC